MKTCITAVKIQTKKFYEYLSRTWGWARQSLLMDYCLASWGFRFKPSNKIFCWPFQGSTSFVDLLCVFFCLVFAMSLFASVYMCFVVTCWERADLLALVCDVCCEFVTFPLVSWVRCGTWLCRFLMFAPLLTFFSNIDGYVVFYSIIIQTLCNFFLHVIKCTWTALIFLEKRLQDNYWICWDAIWWCHFNITMM